MNAGEHDRAELEIAEGKARRLGRVFCAACGDSNRHLAALWRTSVGGMWQVHDWFEHTDYEFAPDESPAGFRVECHRHGVAEVTPGVIREAQDRAKGRPFRALVHRGSTPLR